MITFLLTAAALYFLVVYPMNRLAERRKRGEEPPPSAPSEEVKLLTEIRDALAAGARGAGAASAAPLDEALGRHAEPPPTEQIVEHLFDTVPPWSSESTGGTADGGGIARRDVYLRVDGDAWHVEQRAGGADGVSQFYEFDSEDEAYERVRALLTDSGDWRELSARPPA